MKNKVKLYLLGVLIGLDQFANAILGGHVDHTISGRCGYYGARGNIFYSSCAKLINLLFNDPDHCWDSIEWSIMRRIHPNDIVDERKRIVYKDVTK